VLQRPRSIATRATAAAALAILTSRRGSAAWRRRAARVVAQSPVAVRLGLGDLSADRLLEIADDDRLRLLLIQGSEVEPRVLLDFGAPHPELSAVALRRLMQAEPGGLSESLYRTIVLDRADDAARLNLALAAVASAVDRVRPQHGREIFERCLAILGRRLDPYDPLTTRTAGAARQAAAALLARDSDLDAAVIEAFSDDDARANVQMIVASALKERPEHAAERFAAFLAAIAPSSEQAIRFAEDCDADRGTLRGVIRPRPSLIRRSAARVARWPRTWLWIGVSVIAPAVLGGFLALLSKNASKTLASAGIGPGVAIGALALLAAVHILSVQLAAQRLPGPIALASTVTPPTLAAYATGVFMLATSIIGQEHPTPSWKPSLVASGLLVVFVLLVGSVTFLSLRSTGAAASSEVVGRRTIGKARRTGRRAGKLHRAAAELQLVVDGNPMLRRFTSALESAQRFPVKAASSGYLRIDIARLRTSVQRPGFANGDLRLDVLVPPGVAVTSGQEIASLVPVAGAHLDEDDLRAVERPFAVSDERRLERFAELCVALTAQLPLLVKAGDPGGARRVLDVLVALLRAHLCSDAAELGDFAGPLPLSPALTQVIDSASQALKASSSEGERDILARLFSAVLEFARKADGVVTLVAFKVAADASTLAEFGILYDAGQRAALLESGGELASVQRGFDGITGGTSDSERYANEAAGRLVAFCAAVAPRMSRAAWSRWWSVAVARTAPDRVSIALRIGAAALPVANLSLALEIAIALADQDFDALIERVRDRDRSAFESFLSEAYGRLLGTDAEQRIVDFAGFARDVSAAVTVLPG
jgi:hypothetical protein